MRIDSKFHEPGVGVTGSLLSTGRPIDEFQLEDESIPVSIVDAANPNVFIRASDVGIQGIELPAEIEANPDLLA